MGPLAEALLRQQLTGKGSRQLFVYMLWRSYQMYTLSRVTVGRKPSCVTSRPPDLRSKGSANLDHYRLRLENVLSWGCPIVWGIVTLDQTVLTSTVRTLTPQLWVLGTAWGISCSLDIFVLLLLLCMTSDYASQWSSLLSSSETNLGPEHKQYLQAP